MPTKSIAEIKKDLEELLVLEPAKALKYLQDMLPDGSEKRNQTILLEGKLSQSNREFNLNLIKFDDHKLAVAQVSKAVLDLATGLSEADFLTRTAPATSSPASPVPKFMIIYDQLDEPHAKQLNRHLNVLKIMKKIRVYNVYESEGQELLARAKQEMTDSDYLIVLITVNLFNSEWFELVYNALGENRRMIPIRIEKADFEGTGLEKFKSLPSMGKAVSDFPSQDAAYADIVGELKKLLPK
ncbi:MAG: toll/interleukin-1 receptor domain-containing protein [Saprospiraceae bacterium]|nr:toll/interleukin-1 receptor domain-containing protein [Saprospiraceae bacterium]